MVIMPVILIPSFYYFVSPKQSSPNTSSRLNPETASANSVVVASPSLPPESKKSISIAATNKSDKLQEENLQNTPVGPMIQGIPSNSKVQSAYLRDIQSLQYIVDGVVESFYRKGLPTEKLSISLMNVKNPQCQLYAQYQDKTPRFPASVSKLFWMAALYEKINSGVSLHKSVSRETVRKMIQKSDNEAASDVVDAITGATSGEPLDSEQLAVWNAKRQSINSFFKNSGYQSVDVSQKNFPIPKLGMLDPSGPDLQIRGDEKAPIRNSLMTYDVTRLAYEIHSRRAVSPELSERMEGMMVRDLNPDVWKQEQYNSIQGFLAEKLPLDTYVASKVGWTSSSRQDVAIIRSKGGEAHYILTVFGDDKKYADDWDIFPAVSRQIFEQMKHSGNSSCGSSYAG